MKVHEYQAKEMFAAYGLVDKSIVCRSVEDAVKAYEQLDTEGDREGTGAHRRPRQGGGVKLANGEVELRRHAADILGMDIKGSPSTVFWWARR